jgi:toxin FitB
MIVLDTNVVSEPMRANADPAIRHWLDQQVAETLYLTVTSLSELLVGIEILPEGRRKEVWIPL